MQNQATMWTETEKHVTVVPMKIVPLHQGSLFIITGASKGLGYALANEALSSNHCVVGISRSAAEIHNPFYYQINSDLANLDDVRGIVENIFSEIVSSEDLVSFQRLVLVNNAATIAPLRPVASTSTEDLIASMHLNLLAPMILTAQFLQRLKEVNLPKTVVNIGSGAASSPQRSWAAYCAAKAGMQIFSQVVSDESAHSQGPNSSLVKVIHFNPGVVDTGMQHAIRLETPENFPEIEKFKAYYREGKLKAPETVARELIDLVLSG